MAAADEPVSGEQQLISRAKEGDHSAFRQLVERHMKQTYNVAFNFVGDHDAAEEVTQQTFVRVHASLRSFRGDSGFSTWLYRITTNLALNYMKQYRRRADRTVDIANDDAKSLASHDSDSENGERREHIERALHELPTLQRAVVILRHFDGLSTKQVSQILRCSEGTVKTHLYRGLRKMRSKLVFLQEIGI
jgi:RNA polymerase sigma-70 factor, ECF subfamily